MTERQVINLIEQARREGAEKALFYAACMLARLPVAPQAQDESAIEWQGRYRAICEEVIHVVADQIERGELNLKPLPRSAV